MNYQKLNQQDDDSQQDNDSQDHNDSDIDDFGLCASSSYIWLNKTNITNSSNNKLTYTFPHTIEFGCNSTIKISFLKIWYSWINFDNHGEKYTLQNPEPLDNDMSYIITCNLIDYNKSPHNDVLLEFTAGKGINFGNAIFIDDNKIIKTIKPGWYSELSLSIFDRNYNEIEILEEEMVIMIELDNIKHLSLWDSLKSIKHIFE